jgi:hypothetical protein
MAIRSVIVSLWLCALAPLAQAQEAALPFFAQGPAAPPEAANPWAGLAVGSEVFALAGRGVRGGHVGGDGFVQYNHAFADNWFVSVQGSAGYSPSLWSRGPAGGFDFAMTNVKVGYDMGRLKTYMSAGVGLAKASDGFAGAVPNAADSFNNLFVGAGPKAITDIGAGFDYAVTDRLTVSVSVSATQGRGFVGPLAPP